MHRSNSPNVVVGDTRSRYRFYRSIIERANKSVVVLFETAQLAQQFAGSGVEVYSSVADKNRTQIWARMLKDEKIILAATRQGVMLPNIGTLIIDEPDRFGYKNDQTPKYQTLDVALWRNSAQHVQLVIGGPSLTLATKMLVDDGAKFIGHGPTSKIIVITNLQHGPEPGDLVVVPSKRDIGGYQWAHEVHTGQVADLQGSWPRAWFLGLDTLASIPDFNQLEKIYLLLQRLRWLTRELYVYSKNPEHAIFQEDFLDKELASRKLNELPPYCRLVKITRADDAVEIRKMPRSASASAFIKNIVIERGDRVDIDPITILK